jgi:prevent-host-death family protein
MSMLYITHITGEKTMTRLSVNSVRKELAETLNRVSYKGERVVVERRGKGVAAIVPVEDLELLEALEDRLDLDAARAALKEAEIKGTVSWARLKKELGV